VATRKRAQANGLRQRTFVDLSAIGGLALWLVANVIANYVLA
jgi:hypothetical protein